MSAPSLIRLFGGDVGFGPNELPPNDDGFSPEIIATSVFENGLNFFGVNYTSFWVNTNGSITFDAGLSTFTPEVIESGSTPGIFPFWGDVDIRNQTTPTLTPGGASQGSNMVYWAFDTENDRIVITWDDTGYFNEHNDLSNSFQLILEDASDIEGRSPGDFNIEFRYEELQWSAGDASGGTDGFGGTPARAGYSAGNAEGTYFELPVSGDEIAMTTLEDTQGNTGQDGIWRFEIRNGNVPQTVTIRSTGELTEGDDGTNTLTFDVERYGDTDGTMTVNWDLVGLPGAAADEDDIIGPMPQSGTLFFDEGVQSQTITVEVIGDYDIEEDDVFAVVLSDPLASVGRRPLLANDLSYGVIIDDDAPVPPPASGWDGSLYGNMHLITYDGLGYDFPAVGEFILVESDHPLYTMNVQIRTEAISDVASAATVLAAEVGASRVTIDAGRANPLWIDGQAVDLTEGTSPYSLISPGSAIYVNDTTYTLVMPSGEQVIVDVIENGTLNVTTYLSNERPEGTAQGLLGDADSLVANDLAVRDGDPLLFPMSFDDLFTTIGDSWRISDAEALFDRAPGETTADWQDTSYPRGLASVDDLPADLYTYTEEVLFGEGVSDATLVRAAVLDLALTGDESYVTSAANVVSTAFSTFVPYDAPVSASTLLISGAGESLEGDSGTTDFTFLLERSGDTSGALDVSYAIGGDINGNDIDGALTGTVSFAAGEATTTIIVPVRGDGAVEFDERLEVAISVSDPDVLLLSQSAFVTVLDDDSTARIIGSDDTELLTGDLTPNMIFGLVGNDTLMGYGSDDVLLGSAGRDSMIGGAGGDYLAGHSDEDSLSGGLGWDSLLGGNENDSLEGGDGFDILIGGRGHDLLIGNNGFDTLLGEAGNDTAFGGLSPDQIEGGAGYDSLSGQAGDDILSGGDDDDTVMGNAGADTLFGNDGNDMLYGGTNFDLVLGGAGDDTMRGDNGADTLVGAAGNDILQGNAGNDSLDGGAGDDILRGGLGADTFVLSSGADVIVDFQNNIDTLEINAALLAEATPVPNDLRDYASINASGNLVLTFGDTTLTLNNINNAGAILDDVIFV